MRGKRKKKSVTESEKLNSKNEVKREPDAAGVSMTTISIIKEADRSQNNGVNLNTAGWLALKARPGVASPVRGGCDIQLQTLAIFLSPVQCLD